VGCVFDTGQTRQAAAEGYYDADGVQLAETGARRGAETGPFNRLIEMVLLGLGVALWPCGLAL
jgi:hypothetical protein